MGGGQDVRDRNVDGGNDVVQENKFNGGIMCKDNQDNLQEEEISREEDGQVVLENK